MSSFYDDASLVVIPSGYKTSKVYAEKPTDGSGDLTFTRTGDTATRVNSAGLIERVRTNLVLQSNTFSTTWANSDSTETGGQAGYDGTNNAWLLTSTLLGGFIFQSVSISGQTTFSVYAKAGSQNGIILYSVHTTQGRNFNLSTGAVGGAFVAAPESSQIQSVGNGWYRCSITISSSSTNNFRIYVGDGSSTALGNVVIQNSQCERGDIATAYIPTTTAAVSVGPVANVPRLDYLGSTCPRLLLEPQRINLKTYSEDFSTTAGWTASTAGGSTVTRTANYGVSPDGYQNADRLQLALNGGAYADYLSANTITNGTTYTYSIYVKSLSGTVSFYFLGGTPAGNILKTATTEWTRITHTFTASSTVTYPRFLIEAGASSSVDLLIWGAQLEAGAYATSYIDTRASAGTRGADAISKTGITSLIGQTEGTFLVDFIYSNTDTSLAQIFSLSNGTTSERVYIGTAFGNALLSVVTSGGAVQANFTTSYAMVLGQRYRAAIAYKANDFAFYINGAQIGTDNAGTVPAMSQFSNSSGAGTGNAFYRTNEILVFKTRLTNAELATLTTL